MLRTSLYFKGFFDLVTTHDRGLSARSARTFYNLVDAFRPPGEAGAPGAGDVDLLPVLERSMGRAGVGSARRWWVVLALVEWLPVLGPRSRRGFSRLPRAERQRRLARLVRIPGLSASLASLGEEVDRALDSGRDHSSDGA